MVPTSERSYTATVCLAGSPSTVSLALFVVVFDLPTAQSNKAELLFPCGYMAALADTRVNRLWLKWLSSPDLSCLPGLSLVVLEHSLLISLLLLSAQPASLH